jgi:hypothetical protein
MESFSYLVIPRLVITKSGTESSNFCLSEHTKYRISKKLVTQRMPNISGITNVSNKSSDGDL